MGQAAQRLERLETLAEKSNAAVLPVRQHRVLLIAAEMGKTRHTKRQQRKQLDQVKQRTDIALKRTRQFQQVAIDKTTDRSAAIARWVRNRTIENSQRNRSKCLRF